MCGVRENDRRTRQAVGLKWIRSWGQVSLQIRRVPSMANTQLRVQISQ